MTDRPAFVLLEDGTWYAGTAPWPFVPAFGEVVFTTSLSGYQETFTDPSYLGQIVVMTAPMIGNYGVNPEDMESGAPQVSAVVVRELARRPSNWRADRSLGEWLQAAGVPVIEGVDTRRLTRHIRERGAMRGVVAEGPEPSAELQARLLASPSMEGLDLASRASSRAVWTEGTGGPHVVAYDFGMKRNIVRMLVASGCRVTVVPADTPSDRVRDLQPDGLFISNGPGDPAAIGYARQTIRELSESGLPTFGICLGHQLIGLAFGGRTVKLPYGHRGGNHPVRDLDTGRVLITSQNHGFAVEGNERGVPGAPALEVTHLNLNDGTVEGLRHRELPIFAVQYHPEASPGPHDAYPHFAEFMEALRQRVGTDAPTP
ncbi:MAG TPA: glutamine-hydrolyzing carbamoyl-phosphate synthase small subunit [Gemmatimonadales bacterium]|nr:glutamine-hydrolyzing carbamoyl-phosphate synthase small subunit [Gemmatimonadales bacterium]